MENFAGVVNLATDAFVMGTFTADDVELGRTGPVGTALEVRGIADVQFTTFTGLPLRISSTTQATAHNVTDLVFSDTSFDPADVQLYLELQGGVNSPLNMSGMQFDSPAFSTGAHVQVQRAAGGPFPNEPFVAVFTTTTPNPLVTITIPGVAEVQQF